MQGDRGEISSNTVFDADVGDGISVIGDNNNVRSNRIFNSDRAAIYVDGSQNRIQNNFVNEAQFGVLKSESASDNDIHNNRFFNTVFDVATESSASAREPAITNFSPTKIDAVRF